MTAFSTYISTYHDLQVTFTGLSSSGNASVHYVTAGAPTLPTIVLFHGFPSSSNQYAAFMPLLADSYHVLAPDLPGFGLTSVPEDFNYTFDNLTAVLSAWLAALNLTEYAIYIFDYGAPIALTIAAQQPEKIKAIISQNGNAYKEGFGQDFWKPIFALWNSSNSAEARKFLQDNVLNLAATEYQYIQGVPPTDLHLVNAESWSIDYLQNIAGAANTERQLDLFYDYRTNVNKYPAFQKYFRDSKVPILALWGKGDPAFIPAGAEAFKVDSPSAVVRFVDAGHFALETKRWEIARIMRAWLTSIGY